MKKLNLLFALMCFYLPGMEQGINVTFTGTDAATQIDSVTATNLTTNQKVTLPGNETLVLGTNTGIPTHSGLTYHVTVYPNPFSGKATFNTIVENPQTVYLKVQNLVGQVVAQTEAFVQPGENDFVLSVNTAGIYMVSITTDEGTASYKVICTETTQSENRIQYLGTGSNNHNNHNNFSLTGLKTPQTSYTLDYLSGDIILYKCFSGIHTMIVTDSPAASKNYEVKFAACTDPDGKNYSIVQIGDQTWTAENLAFLPAVSPSSAGSEDSPIYYVYNYEGNSVSEAKTSANYSTYGVLYNWEAAMNGASVNPENPVAVQGICPNGWHLPSYDEWTALTDYLGFSVAGKMRETGTNHWGIPNEGTTNASGFTALPAGARNYYGAFQSLGELTPFWSATSSGTSKAYDWILDSGSEPFIKSNYRSMGFSVRCLLGQGAPELALLTTTEITSITDTTAISGGNILSNWGPEVTARGVCWNTIEKPTISNSKTTVGSGAGTFTATLTGLRSCTRYYVRAYATNSVGTAYGEQKKLTTAGVGGEGTFDYNGRIYAYKTIGTQTWMTENLAYLPSVSPSSTGSDAVPFYYVFGYEGTSVDAAKATPKYAAYGVLYNWPAAMASCPEGWHLPTEVDWTTLTNYLGGDYLAGGKMKKSGTTYWQSPNTGATNESGFTGIAGGYRSNINNLFDGLGQYAEFWSSSVPNSSVAWYWYLSYGSATVTPRYSMFRSAGVSVRCLRD